jgi:hypothetical protein
LVCLLISMLLLSYKKLLSLDCHQCTSILYHCVTNESPYYFFTLHEEIKESSAAIQNSLSAMSPADLGTWFHTGMQRLIAEKSESELNQVLPRRHHLTMGRVLPTQISPCLLRILSSSVNSSLYSSSQRQKNNSIIARFKPMALIMIHLFYIMKIPFRLVEDDSTLIKIRGLKGGIWCLD